jgi:hypothetical protein
MKLVLIPHLPGCPPGNGWRGPIHAADSPAQERDGYQTLNIYMTEEGISSFFLARIQTTWYTTYTTLCKSINLEG